MRVEWQWIVLDLHKLQVLWQFDWLSIFLAFHNHAWAYPLLKMDYWKCIPILPQH